MNRQSYGERNRAAQDTSLFSSEGKKIAEVLTDESGQPYLLKKLRGSRHFLRTVPGVAVDAQVIDKAESLGCVMVKVIDQETGTVYTTCLDSFRKHGALRNWGWGPQIALSFCWWDQSGPDGQSIRLGKSDQSSHELDKQANNKHSASVEAQRPLFDGEGAE